MTGIPRLSKLETQSWQKRFVNVYIPRRRSRKVCYLRYGHDLRQDLSRLQDGEKSRRPQAALPLLAFTFDIRPESWCPHLRSPGRDAGRYCKIPVGLPPFPSPLRKPGSRRATASRPYRCANPAASHIRVFAGRDGGHSAWGHRIFWGNLFCKKGFPKPFPKNS